MFQSTHPHGVRQEGDNEQIFQYQVSIHAPTRGATKIKIKILLHASVSIHAPTRGATHLANSPARNTGVSIHAPTRGATRTRIVISGSEAVSIHAPTRGATSDDEGEVRGSKFQSTHPHGVRRDDRTLAKQNRSFNPRTHTGCDLVQSW